MKPAYTFLILFSILFFCIGLTAEAAESTPAHLPDTLKLGEVEVVAKRKQSEVIPVQVLSGEELQKLNSNSVADAFAISREYRSRITAAWGVLKP